MTLNLKDQAIAALKARVEIEVKKANELFGVDLVIGKNLAVKFTLRARSAGRAMMQGYSFNRKYELNFNVNMMIMSEKAWWHLLDETVSHEVAHIVDYVQRGKSGHDARWQYIHKMMGGSGKTYHDLEVPVNQHVYGVAGQKVVVNKKVHDNIQKGHVYRTRNGKHPIKPFDYVGPQDKSMLTYVPTRKGEAAPTVTVVTQKVEVKQNKVEIKVPAKVVGKKVAAQVVDTGDGKKRYAAPSGEIVRHRPSKLANVLWEEGIRDRVKFIAEYEARGGKSASSAFHSVFAWYVGKN
ncbi:hypothetical protein Aeh1ORF062c [Aeromonas phage Aeh1]|uniref:SprT-like domain-containing protein n=1 Tax=Aeromonas phage Aeh1 TaxID=2880362 RepID=Q76Z24_9CAUD|nr:hypothetical protein Aeh1p067 [Aeromonas phage Aeh1]AAQ17722.1 hypothetical protein Aeh1ORF062c [Aeromonas phage Aeh1]